MLVRHKFVPTIPRVLCPMCAHHMRFATFEPMICDGGYRMTFDCECDFRYQLSETAAEVLVRNNEEISLAPLNMA